MSRLVLALTLLLLGALPSALPAAPPRREAPQAPLRVMTWNLRYDNPGDGPNAWPHRRDAVLAALHWHRPDLLCIQEGLAHQVDFLKAGLGWEAYGAGRDDGRRAGEQVAILFDPARWTRLDGGHFWLSPTPERPGRAWDAACTRMATWVTLRDRQGITWFVMNTHLDHEGATARLESARLLARRIRDLAGPLPVILAGDFNTGPGSEVEAPLLAAGLRDARPLSRQAPHGPARTFWGFDPARPEAGDRIDDLFLRGLQVEAYATPADLTPKGHFLSDHLPVMAEVLPAGRRAQRGGKDPRGGSGVHAPAGAHWAPPTR